VTILRFSSRLHLRTSVTCRVQVAKDRKGREKGSVVPAQAVIERRVRYGTWFINPRNPYVRRLEPGDRGLMLALGREERQFMGELTINSNPLPVDAALESLKEGLPSAMLTHYLKISSSFTSS
jgi:hypothetical protein